MTMTRIATGAASAALLLMTFVAPANAEGNGGGNGCNDNGQCSAWAQTETQEREEVDRAEQAEQAEQAQQPAASNGAVAGGGDSDPGYRLPSTWEEYSAEEAMAEWRRRSPESFGPTGLFGGLDDGSDQPTGTPPCGLLVVPYTYTPCEGEEEATDAPETPAVTIGQVISMAMARLSLPAPDMGSAPCADAGCTGTVGAPVWFWLEGDQWRTHSATASAGGLTVGIQAKPSKVVWKLGDGQSVTCTGAGTPYDTSKGWASSPDCGLPKGYTRPGSYTATATITYAVTFTGDASGSTTVTRSSTSNVTVGEYQAVGSRRG